jgi:hypothetical protein
MTITLTREEAQQVLDALELANGSMTADDVVIYTNEEIEILRARLAQPEPEPLEYWNAVEGWVNLDEVRQHFDSVGCGTIYKKPGEERQPLYTAPPQQECMPDDLIATYEKGVIDGMQKQRQSSVDRAVNKMAKREWQGLTDEEIKDILDCGRPNLVNIKKAEQKLKEKNT